MVKTENNIKENEVMLFPQYQHMKCIRIKETWIDLAPGKLLNKFVTKWLNFKGKLV